MFQTKRKLKSILQDHFFGNKFRAPLIHFNQIDKSKFIVETREICYRALTYIEKHYGFENNCLKCLAALNMRQIHLNFEDILEAAAFLNIKINEDRLYDEINVIKQ